MAEKAHAFREERRGNLQLTFGATTCLQGHVESNAKHTIERKSQIRHVRTFKQERWSLARTHRLHLDFRDASASFRGQALDWAWTRTLVRFHQKCSVLLRPARSKPHEQTFVKGTALSITRALLRIGIHQFVIMAASDPSSPPNSREECPALGPSELGTKE